MKNIFIPVVILLFGCNNNKQAESSTDTPDTIQKMAPATLATGCYKMVVLNDSAFLTIEKMDDHVTGTLQYRWFEKDKNDGTIKGIIKDSLLVVNYTFNAEGRKSVREVVFKIKKDTLVEGFGDISMNGIDTVKFKDISTLNFMNDRPFVKYPCK